MTITYLMIGIVENMLFNFDLLIYNNNSFLYEGCITGLTIVIAVYYTKNGKIQQVKEQNCASR